MKKLFFSALVAIVAVGGALSTNAQTLYELNSSIVVPCNSTPASSCLSQTGLTEATDGENQSEPVINITNYTYQP